MKKVLLRVKDSRYRSGKMAVQIAGNLKELIEDGAARYIALNPNKFKSTTPGPVGPDGPRGPQGEGVHHMKGTSTTDPEGDFSTAGEYDTYTFYADAHEKFPLAWFTIKNGEDPWRRAVDMGYRGTEEEFYTTIGHIQEYADRSEEAIEIAENAIIQVEEGVERFEELVEQIEEDLIEITQLAEDIEEDAQAVENNMAVMQGLFLGHHATPPTTDNLGNPLKIGAMYYNSTLGTQFTWTGTDWSTAIFGAEGAVTSFNTRTGKVTLLNEDITLAVGLDVSTTVTDLKQIVDILEGDETVVGSVDNKIELRAQDAIYDDDNGLGADTIKEALDKLVLDLYKVKEW